MSDRVLGALDKTYLIQSTSLTSCEEKGCGSTIEGGGTTGNPPSKCLLLAIRYVGGKGV
jgi:hypothetical protein